MNYDRSLCARRYTETRGMNWVASESALYFTMKSELGELQDFKIVFRGKGRAELFAWMPTFRSDPQCPTWFYIRTPGGLAIRHNNGAISCEAILKIFDGKYLYGTCRTLCEPTT